MMCNQKFSSILIILFSCIICIVPASACLHVYHIDPLSVIEWELNESGPRDEMGYDIHETCDGGYILTGTIGISPQNPAGISESTGILVRKLDAGHNISWERIIGESGRSEGRKIRETSDGGFFVVGMTTSNDGSFKGLSHGGWDVVAAKINATGTPEWVRNYGGSNDDFGENIRLTKKGAIIIGRTFSNDTDVSSRANYSLNIKKSAPQIPQRIFNTTRAISANSSENDLLAYLLDDSLRETNEGQSDVWVVEIDPNGNILWQQRYGGSRDDYGYDVFPLSNGSILFTGITFSNDGDIAGKNFGEDTGTSDGWLIRLNPDHTIGWQNCFGGSENEGFLSMESAEYPSMGGGCSVGDLSNVYPQKTGYFIAGFAKSKDGDVFPRPMKNHESYDGWIVRTNADLVVGWTQCIGGSRFDVITSAKQTNRDKDVFSGMTLSSDGDISRPMSSGSLLLPMVGLYNRGDSMIDWMKFPGNNEIGLMNSVEITQDGGYLTAGWTTRPDGPGKHTLSGIRLSTPAQPIDASPIPGQKWGTSGTPTPESVRKSVTKMNPDANITQEVTDSSSVPSRTPVAPLPVLIPVAAAGCVALWLVLGRFCK
jgi:hypothetical protein